MLHSSTPRQRMLQARKGRLTCLQTVDKRPTWSELVAGISIDCFRNRYKDDSRWPKRRTVTIRFLLSDVPVASAKFVEWWDRDIAHPEDFFWAADEEGSVVECEGARAINEHWEDDDHPLEYGTVVFFDVLFIDTASLRGHDIWRSINAAIQREFRHRAAVMAFKAFPLELKGSGPKYMQTRERYKTAMMRLYRRSLGATPFKGAYGDEGWMWRWFS